MTPSDFWFKEIILAAGIRNRLVRPCLKIEQLGGYCMMLPGEYKNGGRWSGLGRLYVEAKEHGICCTAG